MEFDTFLVIVALIALLFVGLSIYKQVSEGREKLR
jgi:hypothetical protein